jgi:hypothetical protein
MHHNYMEYNTKRKHLALPEYGRNVQRMVEHVLTIEDPKKRLQNAEVIVELMSILNPNLKLEEDYKHRLWDHLHQMANFELDIEGPYPKPTPEELYKKPEPLHYPKHNIKYRHLGKNLESLLAIGMEEKDEERRQGFTQHIGYYMKLAYTNWHKEPIHDDMIKNELLEITKGLMDFETGGFKVFFDNRTQNNFKKGGGNNFKGNANKNNNQRNFNNNNNNNGGYNKNRKFNKNKPNK